MCCIYWCVGIVSHISRLYYYTAVSDAMAVLNASVNFIIYTITSPKFRRGLVTSCQQNTNHVVDQYALAAAMGGTGVGAEVMGENEGGEGASMVAIQRFRRQEDTAPIVLCTVPTNTTN